MLPIRGTRIYFLPFTIQHFLPSEVQIAIRERVLLNPVLGDSVVQVRPRAAAGAADAPDCLTDMNTVTFHNVDRTQMAVKGGETVIVA